MGFVEAVIRGERPSFDDIDISKAPLGWDRLQILAIDCWAQDPSDRPTSQEVLLRLSYILSTEAPDARIPDISSVVTKAEKGAVFSGGYYEVFIGYHETHGKVAMRRPMRRHQTEAIRRLSILRACAFRLPG